MEIRGKTLEQWKQNAEENYITTPIIVLKYVSILEEVIDMLKDKPVTELNERNSVDEGEKSFVYQNRKCNHCGEDELDFDNGKLRCLCCGGFVE